MNRRGEIRLYEWPAPGTEHWAHDEQVYFTEIFGTEVITNVVIPTLTPVVPENGDGTAIIIARGGGDYSLSVNREGRDVANWLIQRVVAAFVLKYRLVPCEGDAVLALIDKMAAGTAERDRPEQDRTVRRRRRHGRSSTRARPVGRADINRPGHRRHRHRHRHRGHRTGHPRPLCRCPGRPAQGRQSPRVSGRHPCRQWRGRHTGPVPGGLAPRQTDPPQPTSGLRLSGRTERPAIVRPPGHPRQEDILSLLASGLSNAEIAERLDVTQPTVKSHVSALLRTFGVRDRTKLALLANQRLTSPQPPPRQVLLSNRPE